ncbi:LANO_0H11122g1_1 [Lachancea nothofagi CBS 11611]|uniref:LANO_0H11122g1_1 n=1 Tax=Lachancea nothofagi CBS 11611 TaxID=1266666 RepID=A0A1G4KM07_9SACH|nr:LANO_0H11122g1_1 [Lachancea nothofagi CBS 11611]
MLLGIDALAVESPDSEMRGKSRLAGILRSFSGPASPSQRKKPTISNPRAEFPISNGLASSKRAQVFLDVLQDYLPHENDHKHAKSHAPSTSASGQQPQQFLNVHRGEIVQLVETAPNNLVKVRLVNRLGQGLVPARCLAVNPNLTPSRLSSALRQESIGPRAPTESPFPTKTPLTPPCSTTPSRCQTPVTNSGLLAIESCQVKSIQLWENRIWYRVDCIMTSGHHRALSRFYQDFYSLQLLLRDEMMKEGLENVQDLLPGLPTPCRSVDPSLVETRVEDFNKYLREVIQSSTIPQTIKRDIVQNKWLSPRPGDMVKTPRGSIYKVKKVESWDSEEFAWEAVNNVDNIDNTDGCFSPIPCYNALEISKENANSIKRSSSFSEMSSKPEIKHTPATASSAPTTPAFSQIPIFRPLIPASTLSWDEKSVKLKLLYKDECFVAKCAPSELNSYQDLDFLCRTKLKGYFPDSDIPLTISYINDKQESVTATEESFNQLFMGLKSSKLTSYNTTCPPLKKLVVRVSA